MAELNDINKIPEVNFTPIASLGNLSLPSATAPTIPNSFNQINPEALAAPIARGVADAVKQALGGIMSGGSMLHGGYNNYISTNAHTHDMIDPSNSKYALQTGFLRSTIGAGIYDYTQSHTGMASDFMKWWAPFGAEKPDWMTSQEFRAALSRSRGKKYRGLEEEMIKFGGGELGSIALGGLFGGPIGLIGGLAGYYVGGQITEEFFEEKNRAEEYYNSIEFTKKIGSHGSRMSQNDKRRLAEVLAKNDTSFGFDYGEKLGKMVPLMAQSGLLDDTDGSIDSVISKIRSISKSVSKYAELMKTTKEEILKIHSAFDKAGIHATSDVNTLMEDMKASAEFRGVDWQTLAGSTINAASYAKSVGVQDVSSYTKSFLDQGDVYQKMIDQGRLNISTDQIQGYALNQDKALGEALSSTMEGRLAAFAFLKLDKETGEYKYDKDALEEGVNPLMGGYMNLSKLRSGDLLNSLKVKLPKTLAKMKLENKAALASQLVKGMADYYQGTKQMSKAASIEYAASQLVGVFGADTQSIINMIQNEEDKKEEEAKGYVLGRPSPERAQFIEDFKDTMGASSGDASLLVANVIKNIRTQAPINQFRKYQAFLNRTENEINDTSRKGINDYIDNAFMPGKRDEMRQAATNLRDNLWKMRNLRGNKGIDARLKLFEDFTEKIDDKDLAGRMLRAVIAREYQTERRNPATKTKDVVKLPLLLAIREDEIEASEANSLAGMLQGLGGNFVDRSNTSGGAAKSDDLMRATFEKIYKKGEGYDSEGVALLVKTLAKIKKSTNAAEKFKIMHDSYPDGGVRREKLMPFLDMDQHGVHYQGEKRNLFELHDNILFQFYDADNWTNTTDSGHWWLGASSYNYIVNPMGKKTAGSIMEALKGTVIKPAGQLKEWAKTVQYLYDKDERTGTATRLDKAFRYTYDISGMNDLGKVADTLKDKLGGAPGEALAKSIKDKLKQSPGISAQKLEDFVIEQIYSNVIMKSEGIAAEKKQEEATAAIVTDVKDIKTALTKEGIVIKSGKSQKDDTRLSVINMNPESNKIQNRNR